MPGDVDDLSDVVGVVRELPVDQFTGVLLCRWNPLHNLRPALREARTFLDLTARD
jgi:hypothetical protein